MSFLGIFGSKNDPVTAPQVKELLDTIMSKVAHDDPKVANQWLQFYTLVFSQNDENTGIMIDMMQKLKASSEKPDSFNWSFAFKALLRKENPFPNGGTLPPQWLLNPTARTFSKEQYLSAKKTLENMFTVESFGKELLEHIKPETIQSKTYKTVHVSPIEVGYRGKKVVVKDFISFMVREYPVTYCSPELAVFERIDYTNQPKGLHLIVAMKPLVPKSKKEDDVFRISHYSDDVKKKKKIAGSALSLCALNQEKTIDDATKFLFVVCE